MIVSSPEDMGVVIVATDGLSAQVKKIHQTYYLPTMTGLATAIFEDQSGAVPVDRLEQYQQRIQPQTTGVEALPGTYPFRRARNINAYRAGAD